MCCLKIITLQTK